MKVSTWVSVSEMPVTFYSKAITVKALTYTLKIDDLQPISIFHLREGKKNLDTLYVDKVPLRLSSLYFGWHWVND